MEARALKLTLAISAIFLAAPGHLTGASHRTRNFVVTATTPEIAAQVAKGAEFYRKQIAVEWLGQELPNWSAPCPILVEVGQVGAGGATSFSFDRGEVFGWNMRIQGSLERIMDSVLPHEVSHTIFACYFRRPLPRWADEGAATLSEHESEKRRQVKTCEQIIRTSKRIPLRNLVAMKDYPPDMQDVLTLYAEGYSLAELLVQQGGKPRYLQFLVDAHTQGWDQAVSRHYGFKSLDALEANWHEWIIAGSPLLNQPDAAQVASTQPRQGTPANTGAVIRAQSPDAGNIDPFLTVEQASRPNPLSAPVAVRSPQVQVAADLHAPPAAAAIGSRNRPARQHANASADLNIDLGAASPPAEQVEETHADFNGNTASESSLNAGWEPLPRSHADQFQTDPATAQEQADSHLNSVQNDRELPADFGTTDELPATQATPTRSSVHAAASSKAPLSRLFGTNQKPAPIARPAARPARRRPPQWSEFPQEPRR